MNKELIHWLGGKSVTPACGAWAFCAGVRTDLLTHDRRDWSIPKKRITCRACLKILRTHPKDFRIYRDRKKLWREVIKKSKKTLEHARDRMKTLGFQIPPFFHQCMADEVEKETRFIEFAKDAWKNC